MNSKTNQRHRGRSLDWLRRRWVWLFVLVPLTGRAHTYDMYQAFETKGSFCTVIGGACAADPDFGGGFFQNPAALTALDDNFDFDFDFDVVRDPTAEPGVAGLERFDQGHSMFAVAWAHQGFGVGLSFAREDQSARAASRLFARPQTNEVHFTADHFSLPLAYRWSERLSIGASLNVLSLDARSRNISGASLEHTRTGKHSPNVGVTAGVLYRLRDGLYVGGWWRSSQSLDSDERIRGTVAGHVIQQTLSRHFVEPWVSSVGATWTPDSSAVTWLAQLDYVERTHDGQLFDFADAPRDNPRASIAKGQRPVVAPHLGVRGSIRPRWTLFGGSYLEVARTAEVESRLHLSAGVSYKVHLGWAYWEDAELMTGIDSARDYQQLIFTFR